jgi:hypothetical protein
MMFIHFVKICVVCLGLMGLFVNTSTAGDQWFTVVYTGKYTDTALNEIIRFNTRYKNSYVHVFSVGKEIGGFKDKIGMEIEGQLGWHSGVQDHCEFNLSYTLRWLPFFWDRYLDTSFAFGNGVSYATSEPELEIRESNDKETNQWLYYILVELAFAVPNYEQYDFFVRIHHRSSVFGAISGIVAGSNFVGAGLRYRF